MGFLCYISKGVASRQWFFISLFLTRLLTTGPVEMERLCNPRTGRLHHRIHTLTLHPPSSAALPDGVSQIQAGLNRRLGVS